jgi:hypothetical protein
MICYSIPHHNELLEGRATERKLGNPRVPSPLSPSDGAFFVWGNVVKRKGVTGVKPSEEVIHERKME